MPHKLHITHYTLHLAPYIFTMKSKLTLLFASFVLLMASCAAPATSARTKVKLPMGYIANVQYAPFYVAAERGYFAAAGIDLEFDYKFETDGVKLVAAGELPFAVVSGEQVVLARNQGLPVKYVAQWYHAYPIAVIAPAASAIKTPADLKGKTVGLPGLFGATYVGWRAFLAANGLSEADVKQQEIGFTQAAALQAGKVDAVVGYVNNEPIVLEQNGFPVKVFAVSDYANMVANGLLTSESVIKQNPQLVKGMVGALMKGLADTVKDPDAAMQISTKYVDGLKVDDAIQKKVLLASVKLMQPSGGLRPGETTAAAWANTQKVLLGMGQVKTEADVNTFFTNEFLP